MPVMMRPPMGTGDDAPWHDLSSSGDPSVQGPLPMPEFVLAACQAAAASVEVGSGSAFSQLSQGFKHFTAVLAPTQGENTSAGVVMNSLRTVLHGIAKRQRYPWSVAEVLLVGSAKTRTGLRGT